MFGIVTISASDLYFAAESADREFDADGLGRFIEGLRGMGYVKVNEKLLRLDTKGASHQIIVCDLENETERAFWAGYKAN